MYKIHICIKYVSAMFFAWLKKRRQLTGQWFNIQAEPLTIRYCMFADTCLPFVLLFMIVLFWGGA